MYHKEYVIFDLKTKKRIMVDDLLQTQVQQNLLMPYMKPIKIG